MTNNEIINEELLTLLRDYTHENEDGEEDPYAEYRETEAKCKTLIGKYNITINETPIMVTNYPIDLGLLDKLVIELSCGVTGCTPDIVLYKYEKPGTNMYPYDETITIKSTNIFGVYIYSEEIDDYERHILTTNSKLINDFDYKFYTE